VTRAGSPPASPAAPACRCRRHAGLLAGLQDERVAGAAKGRTDLSVRQAGELADRMNRSGPVKWSPVETGDGTYAVIPKALADRWKAATREKKLFGRALDTVNQRFVRAVLPLSAMWHAGNAVDMMTRLALTGARPGDAQLAHQLRAVLADHDEEWARLALDSVGGAHLRGQSVRDHRSVARHIPILDDAIDGLFALGRQVEAKAARSAQGTALRAQAKAPGEYAADARAMVEHWRRRPELVDDFQRRTLEILGDYVHHPLVGSHDLRAIAPFIQWIKASLQFTFHTLPAKHPVRTALLFNLAQMTEKQRAQIGASQYITPQQARALGLPRPRTGFLAGGLALPYGTVMPTAGMTSLSAAAGLIDDPLENVGRILVPRADRPACRALASRDSATEYAARTINRLAHGEPLCKAITPGARPRRRRTGNQARPRRGGVRPRRRVRPGLPPGRRHPPQRTPPRRAHHHERLHPPRLRQGRGRQAPRRLHRPHLRPRRLRARRHPAARLPRPQGPQAARGDPPRADRQGQGTGRLHIHVRHRDRHPGQRPRPRQTAVNQDQPTPGALPPVVRHGNRDTRRRCCPASMQQRG
jgi:hypothetical protein